MLPYEENLINFLTEDTFSIINSQFQDFPTFYNDNLAFLQGFPNLVDFLNTANTVALLSERQYEYACDTTIAQANFKHWDSMTTTAMLGPSSRAKGLLKICMCVPHANDIYSFMWFSLVEDRPTFDMGVTLTLPDEYDEAMLTAYQAYRDNLATYLNERWITLRDEPQLLLGKAEQSTGCLHFSATVFPACGAHELGDLLGDMETLVTRTLVKN